MFKKIILALIVALIIAYLSFSIYYSNFRVKRNLICKEFRVNIFDSSERQYLLESDIINTIAIAGLSPVGKDVTSINTAAIEKKLMENRLVKQAECFKTVDGTVQVNIFHRTPVLRVFSMNDSYYVDSSGEKMPVPENYAAYVPVATGFVEDDFAKEQLFEFAIFLQQDKFWNSQIKQIYVAQNEDIELTPAVGNHRIILGKIENYKEKLDKLRLFYDKGLSKVGWNKYSVINLKFKNQVICKK